ncbi:hypothetical protein [Gymnodinialimonas sp. 57CJ19]|uniref:hypothetical protein n=1 Tax=Gymnodinialimonas sp. 57CJ19 TaxID=3138498 RepID=UPI0031345510
MSLADAVAVQPFWVRTWVIILVLGAYFLPVSFLIWKQSRVAGVLTLGASILAAYGVSWMYDQLGYVKLLGLAHVVFWTPLAVYLWRLVRREDMPIWPRGLMSVSLAIIVISLAFDYVDVGRWVLGEREALAGTLALE